MTCSTKIEILAAGFHIITRARTDISICYYWKREGRKRKWDGKVELTELDLAVFSRVEELETTTRRVWQGIVNPKSVNLKIKAVIIQKLDDQEEIKEVRTCLSTDT